MIKAILFDMDGTIIDDEKYTVLSKIKEGKKLGYNIKKEDVLKTIGLARDKSCRLYKDIYGEDFPFEELSVYRTQYIINSWKNGIKLKPYVRKIIKFCKKNNIIIGICTSTIESIVNEFRKYGDIFDQFDFVLTGDKILEGRGKPNPDIFLKGLELAGVKKEEALVIEDGNIGVEAALNAGIDVIMIPDLVLPQGRTLTSRVKVYKNMNEVISYIKEVNNI